MVSTCTEQGATNQSPHVLLCDQYTYSSEGRVFCPLFWPVCGLIEGVMNDRLSL